MSSDSSPLTAKLIESLQGRGSRSPLSLSLDPERLDVICVFCGSSSGNNEKFLAEAKEFAKLMLKNNLSLVFGGGTKGIMGMVAKTVHDGGGSVLGVIPKQLAPKEVSGQFIGDHEFVDSMHERKSLMAEKASAFVALPGGYGTLEELLEIITWSQLGIHRKPIGVLNTDGFFNPLLAMFDRGRDSGFITEESHKIVVVGNSPEELIYKMMNYKRPKLLFNWYAKEQNTYDKA